MLVPRSVQVRDKMVWDNIIQMDFFNINTELMRFSVMTGFFKSLKCYNVHSFYLVLITVMQDSSMFTTQRLFAPSEFISEEAIRSHSCSLMEEFQVISELTLFQEQF